MEEAKIIIIVISGTILLLLMGIFLVLFLFLYKKSHNQYLKDKEALRIQFAQTLLQAKLEIQEQTLQHISYELHDNLGQAASLIKINLNTIILENIERSREKIEVTKDLVRQLIADLKSLSVSLGNDWISRKGLVSALTMETERMNRMDQFRMIFTVIPDLPFLKDDIAIILYRMTQELLNNAVKHSGATEITILLSGNENSIILEVKDNGKGFDWNTVIRESNGSGLSHLQERAKLINAALTIDTAKDSGTSVNITVQL